MRLKINSLAILLALVPIYSCSDHSRPLDLTFRWESDTLIVTAKIRRLEELSIQDSPWVFLHGKIEIRNAMRIDRTYNIDHYRLAYGTNAMLSDISYDSVLDYLIRNEVIKGDTSVERMVYWAFRGRLSERDLQSLRTSTSSK
jgi:hypothetical protein